MLFFCGVIGHRTGGHPITARPAVLFQSLVALAVARRHRLLPWHLAQRWYRNVYPHAPPHVLVDDLLVASPLADEVEQLTQALWLLRWHDVSGLTCEVLALLRASDSIIDVPAAEARGHLDRLAKLFTDAVEVVHQSQELSLLRGVGGVVFSEAHGRLASRQLLEREILAHSIICF